VCQIRPAASCRPTLLPLRNARRATPPQERVLLEQPYLLDQNKTVAEAVKEAIAACGENIQVRRAGRMLRSAWCAVWPRG
jgi:hypothetical protein